VSVLGNQKHEHFCQLVAGGASAIKAYVSAGYSEGGAAQNSSRLMQTDEVRNRIAELRSAVTERGVEKASVDQARVILRLQQLSMAAEEGRQFSAAIRAEELLGKQIGMFKDSVQLSGEVDNNVNVRFVE